MAQQQYKPFGVPVAIVAGMLTVSLVFLIMALVVGCGGRITATSIRAPQRAEKVPASIHHPVQPEGRVGLSSP